MCACATGGPEELQGHALWRCGGMLGSVLCYQDADVMVLRYVELDVCQESFVVLNGERHGEGFHGGLSSIARVALRCHLT